jgi:hypothetical protein
MNIRAADVIAVAPNTAYPDWYTLGMLRPRPESHICTHQFSSVNMVPPFQFHHQEFAS